MILHFKFENTSSFDPKDGSVQYSFTYYLDRNSFCDITNKIFYDRNNTIEKRKKTQMFVKTF